MTKPRKTASGYECTIVATKTLRRAFFVEADANVPATVADAHARIEAARAELEAEGYAVKVRSKYRLRADPAQLPMPQTAAEDDNLADKDLAERMAAELDYALDNAAPEAPAVYGRLKRAEG